MKRRGAASSRDLDRRRFLRLGAAGFSAFLGLPLMGGCGKSDGDDPVPTGPSTVLGRLGPLQAPDGNGLRLPAGCTSRIVARSGQAPIAGSSLWHAAPDGGATYPVAGGGWIYVSNAEVAAGGGGASALQFDAAGTVVDAYPILSGTSRNCAGGKLPGGIWLSCEENGDLSLVYECDVLGVAPAVGRPALGRFNHEAAALDPATNVLYLSEDRTDGGLYRFTPASAPGSLDLSSGLLEVAQVTGPGGAVVWITVPDPSAAVTPTRQQVALMTPFNGGEGICHHAGVIYLATKGDDRIWAYDIAAATISVLYDDDTSSTPILTGVDNIELSAEGDVVVAEDGGDMQVVAITPDGTVVPVLQVVGHDASEVAGPAFSPDRTRFYFSSQRGTSGSSSDGVTFEVSGPFAG